MAAIAGRVPSTANSTPLGLLEKCFPEDLSCQASRKALKGLLQAWGRAPTVHDWDSRRLPGPPQRSHGYLPSVPVHGLALGTFGPNSLRNPVSVLLSAAGSPRGSSRRMSQNFATRARASSFRCPQSQLPQARWLTLHNHIGGACGEHQCSFGGLSWGGARHALRGAERSSGCGASTAAKGWFTTTLSRAVLWWGCA